MIPVPVLIGITIVVGLAALFLDDDKPESTDDGKPAADTDATDKAKPKPRKKRARKAKPKPDDEPGNTGANLPASGGTGGVDDANTGNTGGAAPDGAKPDDAGGDTGGT